MIFLRKAAVTAAVVGLMLPLVPSVAQAATPNTAPVAGTALSRSVVAPLAPRKHLTSTRPGIKGKPVIGSTLTVKAKKAKWTNGTHFAYQWYANGKKIPAATKPRLTVTNALKGKQITIAVTGTKAGYAAVTLRSKKTAKVQRKTLITATTPFTKDGRLMFSVTQTLSGGSCRPSAYSRAAQVYRCGSGGYDDFAACWELPGSPFVSGATLYCVSSGDGTRVVEYYAGNEIERQNKPVRDPWPMKLVLETGQQCTIRLGGTPPGPLPTGYSWSYDCSDGSYLLTPLGKNITNQKARWSVKLTSFITETETSPLKTAYVREAVYAGAAPKAPKLRSGQGCRAVVVPLKLTGGYVSDRSQVQCLGSWAMVRYFVDGGGFGPKVIYHRSNGTWTKYRSGDSDALCRSLPSRIPARMINDLCHGFQ